MQIIIEGLYLSEEHRYEIVLCTYKVSTPSSYIEKLSSPASDSIMHYFDISLGQRS